MDSIWTSYEKRLHFPSLQGTCKADVLIIGGGLAGLLCSYMLKKAGVDCVIAEAKQICSGITRDTTAKITVQHGLIYDKLIRQHGEEKAKLYLNAQLAACETYARLCKKIPCDYEQKNAYVYSLHDREKIEKEVSALNRLGCHAVFRESTALPLEIAGAVEVKSQAQFHPLKFAYEIAKTLPVYENTKILELMPHKAVTEQGEILCKKMIVATHFPVLNKHGGYYLKLYQHRSYVLALEDAPDVNGMYVSDNEKGMSFRNYKNQLLLGGGSHRTGKQGGSWKELETFARKQYPSAKVTAKWATQDCMTLDRVPYIGQYAKHTPDVYVATGFNKWGMSSSMVSAMLLTDLVLEKHNDYAKVFSPSRSMLHPQLAVNAFESLVGLITPSVPRCPHLGCVLKYNPEEHSWDCPCHGSRFNKNGELIDNPATDDKHL